MWQHGLLVHVPKGVVLEQPLYVRVAQRGRGRLALLAAARHRRGGRALHRSIEEYASDVARLEGVHERRRRALRRAGAKLEYVSIQNLSRETWHFATHHARVDRDAELDWVAGGFGSKQGKTRIQNDLAGRGATSRVTGAYFADGDQHLDYDTFQEHMAPTRRPTSPSKARSVTDRRPCGAG